jgi:CHASE3 domain sensor protein
LLPALNQIDARSWVDQGASETYAEQLQAAKDQTQSLADGARALAKNPERLPAALELYFRMQGIDAMLASVEEGMRKYQNPASAQALASLQAETGANRDRLQRYVVSLAAEREQELHVMDQEAQRCRGTLTAPPSKSGKKKQ